MSWKREVLFPREEIGEDWKIREWIKMDIREILILSLFINEKLEV